MFRFRYSATIVRLQNCNNNSDKIVIVSTVTAIFAPIPPKKPQALCKLCYDDLNKMIYKSRFKYISLTYGFHLNRLVIVILICRCFSDFDLSSSLQITII